MAPGTFITESGAQDESFRRLVERRWSCRAFLPEPVPHEKIVKLLQIAQGSPSWCNTQPWGVIVTEGNATERFRSALLAHARQRGSQMCSDLPIPGAYTGVHLARRRESGWQLYDAVGILRGDRTASALQAQKNFELFGAPHAAVITVDAAQGAYGVLDAGVYLGNLLLAAESMGIAAVPQAALASYSPFVREFFDIPDNRAVLLGVSFGWPDREHPVNAYRSNRASLDEVVHWVSE